MTPPRRPGFSDIDAWGLTHPGLVRKENQDHFFQGALTRRGLAVERTSVGLDQEPFGTDRLASLGIIADGVGGRSGGGEAARRAVEGLISSVATFFHEAADREDEDPDVFSRLLQDAALAVHEDLLRKAAREGGERSFATTLTLFLGLWPHAYLLQVGDSRGYVFRDGVLTQVSRDQTVAQELIDAGVMSRTMAERTRWADVLSSAVGGKEAAPVVTRVVRDWGTVILMCSDGLTKHVSDERIAARLGAMTSARQVAEQLLEDALEDGGTDNITIIVGRTLPREE